MKQLILSLLFIFLVNCQDLLAQCSMCKTTIVNNVSNGELALAEGLNFGIMYLFAAPYVIGAAMAGIFIFKWRDHVHKSRKSTPKL